MIKKFEEYISEGLWKDGVERAKSGDERLEDKLNTNIKDLIPIDLGVDIEFADRDFEMDGNCNFTHEQLSNIKSYFEKHGWRLPTPKEIKICKRTIDVYFTSKITGLRTQYMPNLTNSKYTDEKVTFNSSGNYWLENGDEFLKHPYTWEVRPTIIDASKDIFMRPNSTLKIRLVRDKK